MFTSFDAAAASKDIQVFLEQIYSKQGKAQAVIAVSGGIDSATSLTLLTKALGPEQVTPLFLPYGKQEMADAQAVAQFNNIPEERWREISIKPIVSAAAKQLGISDGGEERVRLGNLMARARMLVVYDVAKELDALVCGTENKSEKHLAYFTRFGDEASDIEPIQHLYKTQIRALAKHLQIPQSILTKAPSAGLWEGQSDEAELGFGYEEADIVIALYVDEEIKNPNEIARKTHLEVETVEAVIKRINSQHFKHEVPYTLNE